MVAASPDVQDRAARALDFIVGSGQAVTRSALSAHFSRHLLATDLDAIVEALLSAGLITTWMTPSTPEGHRPCTWYAATKDA